MYNGELVSEAEGRSNMWLHYELRCAMILDERGKEMKKNDWLLAAGIILAAVLILAFQLVQDDGGQKEVAVTVDGEEFGRYSLAEDQTIDIDGTNRLVIEDGTARMEWADCPDQVCVNHRAVSRNGESIICLPNRLVISLLGTEPEPFDAVTG